MEELKLGRVYKIICMVSDDVYVGSTFLTLDQRWRYHGYDFTKWGKGYHSTLSIYPSMEKYGVENFKIELIKEYQVCDRHHLELYETLWILKLKSCNQNMPFRIKSFYHKQYSKGHYQENKDQYSQRQRQYYQDNKDYILIRTNQYHQNNKDLISVQKKVYYQKNKDKIRIREKCYRDNHKDERAERTKRYNQENKEHISSQGKEYYEANKQKIVERRCKPFLCECGITIRTDSKAKHFRTKKHLDFLNKKICLPIPCLLLVEKHAKPS